jgi:hypothetical protein
MTTKEKIKEIEKKIKMLEEEKVLLIEKALLETDNFQEQFTIWMDSGD